MEETMRFFHKDAINSVNSINNVWVKNIEDTYKSYCGEYPHIQDRTICFVDYHINKIDILSHCCTDYPSSHNSFCISTIKKYSCNCNCGKCECNVISVRKAIYKTMFSVRFNNSKKGYHGNVHCTEILPANRFFESDGYDIFGYDINGYKKDGYNKYGYGYIINGYNKDGYIIDGYNKDGYDKDGYDKDGYD